MDTELVAYLHDCIMRCLSNHQTSRPNFNVQAQLDFAIFDKTTGRGNPVRLSKPKHFVGLLVGWLPLAVAHDRFHEAALCRAFLPNSLRNPFLS